MSELTPERIRDAAEVLRRLDTGYDVYKTEYSWTPSQLDRKATILEREQAAEVKRAFRIEEIVSELAADLGTVFGGSDVYWHVARALVDRYPALLEGAE